MLPVQQHPCRDAHGCSSLNARGGGIKANRGEVESWLKAAAAQGHADAAGIRPDHAARLRRILGVLDGASSIDQAHLPGFDLHKLSGDLTGYWSVTVNGNWRVIFRFDAGEVEFVDYLDYH